MDDVFVIAASVGDCTLSVALAVLLDLLPLWRQWFLVLVLFTAGFAAIPWAWWPAVWFSGILTETSMNCSMVLLVRWIFLWTMPNAVGASFTFMFMLWGAVGVIFCEA